MLTVKPPVLVIIAPHERFQNSCLDLYRPKVRQTGGRIQLGF